jgi:MFS family permease
MMVHSPATQEPSGSLSAVTRIPPRSQRPLAFPLVAVHSAPVTADAHQPAAEKPRLRLPIYLAHFQSGVMFVSLGPLLDSILRDLGIPLAQGGLPAVVFSLGSAFSIIFLNVCLARVPVKWILVGAAVMEAAGLAASGLLAQGLWSFVGAYFFVGFPCVILTAVPGMWVSVHVREATAWAMNLMMLSSVSGMTIAPLVLGSLLSWGVTWRTIYAGEAVLVLAAAVVFALLPLADIPGRKSLGLRQFRALAGFNPWLLALIAGGAFMYLGAEMTLITWLPKFEVDVFGAGETWASLTVTLYMAGQIIGRLVSIPLTRRYLASSLLFVFSILLAVFAGAVAASPSQEISLMLAFAAGLGSAASFSLISSYSSKFPHWHAGVLFSTVEFTGGIGAMVFPYLVGPVAASVGFRAAMAVVALPVVIVALVALGFRRVSGEARPRTAREV